MGLFQKPKKEKRGIKILLYGTSGVGKSYFALTFPRCAAIDTEDGMAHYTDNPNMVLKLVTTAATEVEDAIDEITSDYMDDVDTVIVDSETKIYENLQHSALVVVERRARNNGRDAFAEGLSQKEWGKIKLIHKRINSKLIELSGKGKNIIMVSQLSDEKKKMGEDFVKIGEKPNGIKGLEYDFDIILKLCYDKELDRRYGVVEKDRTSTYAIGHELENPSFESWKHVFENNHGLEASSINLTANIEEDVAGFEDEEETTIDGLVSEIKSAMKDGLKSKKITGKKCTSILTDYGYTEPNDINHVGNAKAILKQLQEAIEN